MSSPLFQRDPSLDSQRSGMVRSCSHLPRVPEHGSNPLGSQVVQQPLGVPHRGLPGVQPSSHQPLGPPGGDQVGTQKVERAGLEWVPGPWVAVGGQGCPHPQQQRLLGCYYILSIDFEPSAAELAAVMLAWAE